MCQEHAVTRLRPALGTLVAIEARASSPELAGQALEAAYEALSGIERRLHPTRPGSELARLNRARAGGRLPVHPTTVAIVDLCRRLGRATGGLFEPALPGSGTIMHWQPVGTSAIDVRGRACVDMGGIAKGFAVDLAVEAMRRAGAASGLVNAGGDLRVYGHATWTTWLRGEDGTARELVVRDCAVAASDPGARDRPPEHRGYYSGRRRDSHGPGVTAVLAPSAALADALTKVVMTAAPVRAAAILARFRARAIPRFAA
jgi:FAD:protein FMN transferase